MTTTLIVPGLNSSGSAHWQTWLETRIPDAVRVIQGDWKRADLPEWSSRVRREIARRHGPILIAAHSFGALAAVQAAEDHRGRIAGALLVAPADPDKFGIDEMLPAGALGFPATIVASSNDPWLGIDRAVALAVRWGADLIDLGDAGHINAEAGFGPWPLGLALLRQLADKATFGDRRDSDRQKVIRSARRRPLLAETFRKAGEAKHRAHASGSPSPGDPRTIADEVRGFAADNRSVPVTSSRNRQTSPAHALNNDRRIEKIH